MRWTETGERYAIVPALVVGASREGERSRVEGEGEARGMREGEEERREKGTLPQFLHQ